ncbi:MAG: (2Fe-2S)-binding protein [Candidatus Marinimicrobia bacterium]|jgi:carbon-monoxide dehydrogenase small subunit|nr:hypothetical protein [Candidatus Neomarinimicrobiota bacterium]MDP6456727.1 (2Fe-2S)-binding protein [Candidatus Neomarinimicrobiota bacterium]MDP6592668.1 (2Fe-2S)-binding protein [Candidatus Neomarinimicrobiota bacterium]MDP6837013.1 (2Fe-2S)-binding protein [Candidatus Neomarinimicrobiota bacterium]MDP6966882.1 (2Fe-2S)-binding protein [Candidatus Neomarinimicrobiota bacterium]|tara:strand:+ start:45 stop:512 length:468 start_codon:yes stop_codon:yes gene_type:complete
MEQIELTVNGFTRTLLVKPHETLLVTLRERLYLTGTKLGCDEATCGCCTVLLDGKPVLSCITPTMRCEGREILTIEGVTAGDGLHPVQKHMVENGGMQCGFCTPGVVMTAIPFLEENRDASIDDIKEGLSGNLCRCTGYKKIIEAVKDAAEEMRK